MGQAADITTAIRQPMSRGRPPKSTTPVRSAHTEFIAAPAGNIPYPIYGGANPDDLDARADHLDYLFGALHSYLGVLICDTADSIPGGALDHSYLDRLFQDFSAEVVGVIRTAAREMRNDKTWRAP
jgi:hypothetical protein